MFVLWGLEWHRTRHKPGYEGGRLVSELEVRIMKQKHNVAIPQETNDKLDELAELWGVSKTEAATIVVDNEYARQIIQTPQISEESTEAPDQEIDRT